MYQKFATNGLKLNPDKAHLLNNHLNNKAGEIDSLNKIIILSLMLSSLKHTYSNQNFVARGTRCLNQRGL